MGLSAVAGRAPMLLRYLIVTLECLNSNVEMPECLFNDHARWMRSKCRLTFAMPTLLARLPPAPDVRLPLRCWLDRRPFPRISSASRCLSRRPCPKISSANFCCSRCRRPYIDLAIDNSMEINGGILPASMMSSNETTSFCAAIIYLAIGYVRQHHL